MDLSFLVELVKEYGYFSMFLFNWLLLFGMPLPNEVAASFSGVLTELNSFNPFCAFLAAYLGLISSNTFAYAIGRVFGDRLVQRLKRTRLRATVDRFHDTLERRGRIAISLSFFLPGIRWAMPYVVGASRYPLHQYALYAYSAGFVWMLIYFQLGRTFPYAYRTIINHLQVVLTSLSVLIIVILIVRFYFFRNRQSD